MLTTPMRDPRYTRTTREGKKQGISQKVIWPSMALRIGLPGSAELQHDGLHVLVFLQCRTPRETNPKGHWGPNYLCKKTILFASSMYTILVYPLLRSLDCGVTIGVFGVRQRLRQTCAHRGLQKTPFVTMFSNNAYIIS